MKLLITTILAATLATSAIAAPRSVTFTDVYDGREYKLIEFEPGKWKNQDSIYNEIWTSELLFSQMASDIYLNEFDPGDPENETVLTWSEIQEATGIDALYGVKGEEINITVDRTRVQDGRGIAQVRLSEYKGHRLIIPTIENPDPLVDVYVYRDKYTDGWTYSVADNEKGYIEIILTEEQVATIDTESQGYFQEYIAPEQKEDVWVIEATGDYKLYGNDYVIKSNGMLDAEIQLRATLDELDILRNELKDAIAEAKGEIIVSLKDQWSVDTVLTNKVNTNTVNIQNLQKDVHMNTTAINANKTQIDLNTTAIANHETRITDNTNRLNAHEIRILSLESELANLKTPQKDNESAAVKFSREMWMKAKKAKAGNEPVYYKTTQGNVIDLRALSIYDPQHGVAVTKDYQEQMGYRSVWVGK